MWCQAALARLQAEIKENRYDAVRNRVTLSEAPVMLWSVIAASIFVLSAVAECEPPGQARSQQYVQGAVFHALTWTRVIGSALFVLVGVLPIAWFLLSRATRLEPAAAQSQPNAVTQEEILAK